MPIVQENPTYFTDKSVATSSLNGMSSSRQQNAHHQPKHSKYGSSTHNNSLGGRRKLASVTSYEDTEDGSELETFLSSCESNNSFSGSENRIPFRNTHNNNGSLRRKGNCMDILPLSPPTKPRQIKNQSTSQSTNSTSSLSRFSQLFKKSKSKLSVQSGGSSGSTVESSGIGSPTTCTPDSSLSIYTNSLDGDSHSSTNSNQISPKNGRLNQMEESTMEDRFCSTYTFDDCGIFAANMYYNVGEASVFTIYNNGTGRKTRKGSSSTGDNQRDDDEFEDCVQPYYNNTTFSTFPNPKRCSVASAASTTTSSVVPVPLNENMRVVPVVAAGSRTVTIPQDRDGYLKPNEPQTSSRSNLRNVKNLYINDSIIKNEKRSGQVGEVQVDVHTPTTPGPSSSTSLNPVNYSSSSSGGGGFGGSAGSRLAYHFDSAGSSTSAATTLVAGGGGSHNFSTDGLPDSMDGAGNNSGRLGRRNNGQLPIYMNRAYFSSNSISSSTTSPPTHNSSRGSSSNRIIAPPTATSVAADCEPYCSLCASSIMGSPRQRSKMDVAIVKCRECFFSREAEAHIRGFFDKLMTEDKQKMDVTLKSYDLKDLDHPSDRVVVHCAKVQIVIISHHFLQRLKDEASRRPRLSPINRVFRSKNVIAVLLAVSAQEVTDGYESVLPRFSEWFSVDLRSTQKSDPEFCKKFTEQVIKIYNVELSNSSNFSVFPKKVTREQPKICIIFKKPVNQSDEVRVELRAQRQCEIVKNVKMDNPHTMMLRIPDSLSPDREAIVDVSVFINNSKIGGSRIKSELNRRHMEDDDLDRMVKSLPPFLEWFDKNISDTLRKHYKDCTDYTVDPALELMNGIIICKADILPTIMHFAAYYGLPNTAFTVLDEADGLVHCTVQNEFNETPSDIAFSRGNSRIGNMIGDYQEISNSCTAYQYIKDIMDKTTDPGLLENIAPMLEGIGLQDRVGGDSNDNRVAMKEESLVNDVIAEEQDNRNSTDLNTVNSEGTISEKSSGAKSEDDVEPTGKPTPLTRRRKDTRIEHRRVYLNVDKNPEENPDIVRRIKAEVAKCPEKTAIDRRFSIMQSPNYDVPRTRAEEYAMPPSEARPVTEPLKGETPSNSPVFRRKNSGPVETSSGYLIMNDGIGEPESEEPNKEIVESSLVPPSTKPTEEPRSRKISHQISIGQQQQQQQQQQQPELLTRKDSSPTPSSSSSGNDRSRTGAVTTNFKPPPSRANANAAVILDRPDLELIDIMNAIKDKTYDMHIAELLFESWKQRPDVQKSIDEKKEMLDKWREEYRETQAKQGAAKKQSTFNKIFQPLSSVWQKRKKSTSQPPPEVTLPPPSTFIPNETPQTPHSVTSPTGLTFTGPNIPSNTSPNSVPMPPPTLLSPPSTQHAPGYDYRSKKEYLAELNGLSVSEASYRTSCEYSDSSTDSDKFPIGESASSMNRAQPSTSSPAEYNNPMSQRFISQYISPSPADPTRVPEIDTFAPISPISPSSVDDDSYKVPPPPRPVKPIKQLPVPGIGEENLAVASPKPPRKLPANPETSPKVPERSPAINRETLQISPSVPRKPPAVPTTADNLPTSPKLHKKPPVVPAKPVRKFHENDDSSSPPPAPPPRTNNTSPNVFNYIDYKKKNQDTNMNAKNALSESPKIPYENLSAENEVPESAAQ